MSSITKLIILIVVLSFIIFILMSPFTIKRETPILITPKHIY